MNGFSILVVDDEEELRGLLEDEIAGYGFKVYSASSVEEAIEFLQNQSVDILLTDLSMPNGLSGMILCEWVQNQFGADVKKIIMTGYIDQFDEQKALGLGVIDFLPKPFDGGYLRSCIEAVILSDCILGA